jgi:hypothetical protein
VYIVAAAEPYTDACGSTRYPRQAIFDIMVVLPSSDLDYSHIGAESTFHGYPATHIVDQNTSNRSSCSDQGETIYDVPTTNYHNSTDWITPRARFGTSYTLWTPHFSGPSRDAAEALYAAALAYGLMGPGQQTFESVGLAASAPGYVPGSGAVDNSAGYAAIGITGTVVDSSGDPVSGATVSVTSGAQPSSTETGDDGGYALTATVPNGNDSGSAQVDFVLEPETAGLSVWADPAEVLADGNTSTVIEVTLTDPADGSPVEGRLIEFLDPTGAGTLRVLQDTTDASGVARAEFTPHARDPSEGEGPESVGDARREIRVIARDGAGGEASAYVQAYGYLLSLEAEPSTLPACSGCGAAATVRARLLSYGSSDVNATAIAGIDLTFRVDGGGTGTLGTDPTTPGDGREVTLSTSGDGTAILYYHPGATEAGTVERVVAVDAATGAVAGHPIRIEAFDLALGRILPAARPSGVTGDQYFFKAYAEELLGGPDRLDALLRGDRGLTLRLTITQIVAEGSHQAPPFSRTVWPERDEVGTYLALSAEPGLPFAVPVNEGTTWFEARLEAVDAAGRVVPDAFAANNDRVFTVDTNRPEGWLWTWWDMGPLTPQNYVGAISKCMLRVLLQSWSKPASAIGDFAGKFKDLVSAVDVTKEALKKDIKALGRRGFVKIYKHVGLPGETAVKALDAVSRCYRDFKRVAEQGGGWLPVYCGGGGLLGRFAADSGGVDIAEFRDVEDHFVHGLLAEVPGRRAVLVYEAYDLDVALVDGTGTEVTDPTQVSRDGAVAAYLVPVDGEYRLQVAGETPVEIGVFSPDQGTGAGETLRYGYEPVSPVTATAAVGPGSEPGLGVDTDGDGAADDMVDADVRALDTVPPVLAAPEDGTAVTGDDRVTFSFSDAGSGIDTGSVVVIVDGGDATPDALVFDDRVEVVAATLGAGGHLVTVEVADLDWNTAQATRRIVVGGASDGEIALRIGAAVAALLALLLLGRGLVPAVRTRRSPATGHR